MTDAWWMGIVAAALVAGAHTLLRILVDRIAWHNASPTLFTRLIVGGMLARVAFVLLATGLIVGLSDVDPQSFTISLVLLLILSMIGEAVWVMRRLNERIPDK